MTKKEMILLLRSKNILSLRECIEYFLPYKLEVDCSYENLNRSMDVFGINMFSDTCVSSKVSINDIKDVDAKWDYYRGHFYFKTEEDFLTAKMIFL